MQWTLACAAALGLVASTAPVGCAQVGRGLGQACLQDQDCASGLCSVQQCAAPESPDAAPSSTDAGIDAADAGGSDAIGDAATAEASDVRMIRG